MRRSSIAFIVPNRNNTEYVNLAVKSILFVDPHAHIWVMNDACDISDRMKIDPIIEDAENVTILNHDSPTRVGHTVLYDYGMKLAREAGFEWAMIFHADMVMGIHTINNLKKYVKLAIHHHDNPKYVFSATRVEPSLHPAGPEKIQQDFGLYPSEFNYEAFLDFERHMVKSAGCNNEVTIGIFAPWVVNIDEFAKIGGHDGLFAPMELEDSDLFNRMKNAGFSFFQVRDAFVYHFTSRGSRWKDELQKDSQEYLDLRAEKIAQWQRRWQQPVMHNQWMDPIVFPVFEGVHADFPLPPELENYGLHVQNEEDRNVVVSLTQEQILPEDYGVIHSLMHIIDNMLEGEEAVFNDRIRVSIKKKIISERIYPEIPNVFVEYLEK